MKPGQRFAPEERLAVAEAFRSGGIAAAYAAVPERRPRSVRKLLNALGFTTDGGRRDWTTHEVQRLCEMFPSATALEIAIAVRHPVASVESKIFDLQKRGVLPRKLAPRWTPGQIRIVEREVDAILDRLAERFGRTKGAIAHRLRIVLMETAKRSRREQVADLGGMNEHARAKGKAA